jgi:hypothetical protein
MLFQCSSPSVRPLTQLHRFKMAKQHQIIPLLNSSVQDDEKNGDSYINIMKQPIQPVYKWHLVQLVKRTRQYTQLHVGDDEYDVLTALACEAGASSDVRHLTDSRRRW